MGVFGPQQDRVFRSVPLACFPTATRTRTFPADVVVVALLFFVVSVLALFLPPKSAFAQAKQEVREIKVEGSLRTERAAILSYLTFQEGDQVGSSDFDASLKSLFETGLFSTVDIFRSGSTIIVGVKEHPIVNAIAYEGNKRIKEDRLTTVVRLRARSIFTVAKAKADADRIAEAYRALGRYGVSVDPKIIERDGNRVDLVFEITEGEVAVIEHISFVGNSFFNDATLKDEIASKESRWYNIFSRGDLYDPGRVEIDTQQLVELYQKFGFADIRVLSAAAELSEDLTSFTLTFTLDEGTRYRVRDFRVQSRIPEIDEEELEFRSGYIPGSTFNVAELDRAAGRINEALGELGFAFVEVEQELTRHREEQEISVRMVINEAPKVFVERIEIVGNVRTFDEIIRREILVAEGDPYDPIRIRNSRRSVEGLGFFSSVQVRTEPGSSNDRLILTFDVTETKTGAFTLAGGYSSLDGPFLELGVQERNLAGKGRSVSATARLSRRTQIDLSYTEPRFLGRDVDVGVDIFSTRERISQSQSYTTTKTGGGVRADFEINEVMSESARIHYVTTSVGELSSNASAYVVEQAGTTYTAIFGQTVYLDTRNSRIAATDGAFIWLSTDWAGLSGNKKYVSARLHGDLFASLTEDIIGYMGIEFGTISTLDKRPLNIADRFFIGGAGLRGFAYGGVGPIDADSGNHIGGEQYLRGTIEVTLPSGLPENLGVNLAAFVDAGTLSRAKTQFTRVTDVDALRIGAGLGLRWRSPLGPLRLDFAQAISKAESDIEQDFSFSVGSQFGG